MDTFVLSQGQGYKLEGAVARSGGSITDIEWLCEDSNFKAVKYLACGEATLTMKRLPAPKVGSPLNTLINVDRTIDLVYPDWVKTVMHPELEDKGLVEYDLVNVEQWLHDDQKDGKVQGSKIYDKLQEDNNVILKTCLTLRDGKEIQKNGVDAFRQLFKDKVLFLWGSVVQDCNGNLYVPYLNGNSNRIILIWQRLDYDWSCLSPAGRFKS